MYLLAIKQKYIEIKNFHSAVYDLSDSQIAPKSVSFTYFLRCHGNECRRYFDTSLLTVKRFDGIM